jgi:hypothetical protein
MGPYGLLQGLTVYFVTVPRHRRFGRTFYPEAGATGSFKTYVHIYQTTRCRISEEYTPNNHPCEKPPVGPLVHVPIPSLKKKTQI